MGGVLFGSDAITNANNFPASDRVKGNLFALLGATCYGVANTGQEYLISGAPMYEVLSMMGIFGTIINGVQAAIFDRSAFQKMLEVYTPKIGGWIAGFDLLLFLFYSTVPLILRLGSAAFLNISLLTANFWGTAVGVQVFGLTIHWMYPIAFVLIIAGQIFAYIDRAGRPLFSTIAILAFGLLGYMNLAATGETVFNWLLSLSGLAALFTWGSICL